MPPGGVASMSPDAVHTATSYSNFSAYPIPAGSWHSIIGVVTAIVGNILISFALNVQRYAHVRLQREEEQRDRQGNNHQHNGSNSYGAIQRGIAEERAKLNARAEGQRIEEDEDAYDIDAVETDQLIPSIKSPESDDSQSTLRESEKTSEENKTKTYLRSPYWWIGMILMVVGEAGNFLAYGFAAASVVSPLGVVALISNCLIAPIMFKEQFRKRDLLGVVIAVVGAVVVVMSSKDQNPQLGPSAIWGLITRWEFETYFGITVACILGLVFLSRTYGSKTILIDIGLVGLFGGYTALSTKGVASLLSYRLWKVITFPITYLLVLVLVLSAVMQVHYINRALQRFDSTQVIPTQFCIFTIFVVLGSAVLYRDFEQTTAGKVGLFVGGVALTFLGVWCITSGRSRDKDLNRIEYDDEEHEIDLVDEETEHETSEPVTPRANRAPSEVLPKTPQGVTEPAVDSPASFATAATNLPQHTSSSPQTSHRNNDDTPSDELTSADPDLSSRRVHKATSSSELLRRAVKPDSTPQTPPRATANKSQYPVTPPARHTSDTAVSGSSTPVTSSVPRVSLPATLAPGSSPRRGSLSARLQRRSASFIPNPLTSPLMASFRTVVENQRRQSSARGSNANLEAGLLRRKSVVGTRPSPGRRLGSLPDRELDAAGSIPVEPGLTRSNTDDNRRPDLVAVASAPPPTLSVLQRKDSSKSGNRSGEGSSAREVER